MKMDQYCICIYISEKQIREIIYVALCTAVDTLFILGIYMIQPLGGGAAYIIKQEGLGVEVRSTATTRPSDILENPLPSQKRKGCDI